MLSRKEGRNYLIKFYSSEPRKINRRYTDKVLQQAAKHLGILIDIYKAAAKKEYTLTYLLENTEDFDDWVYKLETEKEGIESMLDYLHTHDDEIRPAETYLTFESLGYKWDMSLSCYRKNEWPQAYTKVIEDTDERSIEEEIWIFEDGSISRRIRTTLWDTTDYGKSSRSITYRKKPLTKKIKLAAANLLKYGEKE